MKRLKATMCAVLAGLMLAGCAVQPQTDNKRGGGAAVDLTKYVVKEAAYPAYPKEPRFEDYFDENGEGDWDAYDAAYTEYREALQKLGKLDAEPDGGAVLAFANRTLGRIFADSENRVYSPISLYAALSMLTEMTDGETKRQVMDLLGAADSETLRQTVRDLWMSVYLDDGRSVCRLANGAFLREDGMLCMAENGVVTPFLAQKDVKLRGLHNIENLLAAAAAVWGEVPVEAIQLVGSSFTGVEHRIEPVRVLDGVTYYNDSIGTSPTRTIAGLRSFDQKVILIAGGYDKHIPYEPLAPEITAHVKNLVLMGATGPRIEKAVREDPNFNEAELPIQHADNMQHAVELARACAKPGDIIILSPASASFDLYPNFEVRGREFKSIVNALK